MEQKPKSIKLVDFKEELLPSGRKLLHCIFENKYGSRFYYSWTGPWKDKEGAYGVEKLFLRSLEIEEWNDYEGVWSEELRKVSKEVPSFEAVQPAAEIIMGDITEDTKEDRLGKPREYWRVQVSILGDELHVRHRSEGDKEYVVVGEVNMAWDSLQKELSIVKEVKFTSKRTTGHLSWSDEYGQLVPIGVDFWVWVEKAPDKTEYRVISRKIASCIRQFIRSRLSEYDALKKGFEE